MSSSSFDNHTFQPGGTPAKEKVVRSRKSNKTIETPSRPTKIRCAKAVEILLTAKRQATNGRHICYWLFIAASGLFTLLLIYSISQPYEIIAHQYYFMADVPLWGFQLYYIVSIVNFLLAATMVKLGIGKHLLTSGFFLISITISTMSACYWLPIVFSKGNHTLYRFYLLPISNMIATLLAVYIDRDACAVLKDADENAAYEDYLALQQQQQQQQQQQKTSAQKES